MLRALRDPDATEEVVQAAFVRAYTALADFRGDSTFGTWLHGIAINLCRDRFRAASRREVPLDEAPENALAGGDPADSAIGLRHVLEREIEHLPPRQRSVVQLRLFADLPFAEIARLEGTTVNSVKVSYHHAVQRLRKWLA